MELWDTKTWRKAALVEGHTRSVTSLAFSRDGRLLASRSSDQTVRLWRVDEWTEVARLETSSYAINAISMMMFDPSGPALATLDDDDRTINIWDLDVDLLLGEGRNPDVIQYTSAKVVLVGESNAGKSCLAMRLAEDRYPSDKELGTTHGMRFWQVAPERFGKASKPPKGQRRDVVLWDMGGQDEYRLVHQLFLHDSTLALIFFDPTRGRAAFDEVEAWNKRLLKQLGSRRAARLLVGAKVDKPSGVVDRTAIRQLCKSCGFAGYYETSALTGRGVKKLCKAVGKALDWDSLAMTSRPELFQDVRDEISRRRKSGEVVLFQADLERAVHDADPEDYNPEAVRAVAEQLAAQGALVDTRQGSGERTLVLRIEEVERYAGALILAARNNPRGVPALEERQLASRDVPLPGIRKKSRLERLHERVVLECVAQLLVEHGICFRHEGLLVFPSLFRAAAGPGDEEFTHSVSLYYDFSGAIDNIYASLVAWLVLLGKEFGNVRLWGDRAEFKAPDRGACGVRKVERGRGFARLDVFFEAHTRVEARQLFRGFVEDHLRRHGLEITEHVEVTCPAPGCGYQFSEDDIRQRISLGKDDVGCMLCDTRVDLEEAMVRGRRRDSGVERRVALLTKLERGKERAVEQVRRTFGPTRRGGRGEHPIRILHLSDLHFAKSSNVKNALQPLVADIARGEGLGFSRLDYLVVSGDLTNRASQKEFAKAHLFISKLIKRFKLTAERCVVVPGNHDQSWDTPVYTWQAKRQIKSKDLVPGRFKEQGDGYLMRDEARYGERFANFDKHLYHPLIQLPYPLDPKQQAMAFYHADTGLQFLALNSAWEIDEWFRDRASIHQEALSRGLELMERQQVTGRKKKAPPVLRLAVWHHPVTGNDKIRDDAFMTRLQQAGVRLVLHGHVHEDRADLFRYMASNRIYVTGAGSFGAPAGERPESTPRLYNLLEIERDHSAVRVHTRKLSKEGEAWGPWAVWEGGAALEKRAYYHIKL